MNQKQRQYAIDRLGALAFNRIKEVRTEGTVPATHISVGDKQSLLKSVGLIVRGHNISCVSSERDTPSSVTPAASKKIKKIEVALAAAKDAIMLGDSDEALEVIQQFEGTL